MIRKLFIAVTMFLFALLQFSVFPQISLITTTPNLLIALTSAYGLMRDKKSGLVVGFICGLAIDIFFGYALGYYAVIYGIIGYLNGSLHKLFYPDSIRMPLMAFAASDFIYGVIVYITYFFMNGDFAFHYYLMHVIIPEMIYTVVLMVLLFPIILKINDKIEKRENRSAKKFV